MQCEQDMFVPVKCLYEAVRKGWLTSFLPETVLSLPHSEKDH